MELQLLLPSVGIFLTIVCAATGLMFIVKGQAQRRVRSRLNDVILAGDGGNDMTTAVILRDLDMSALPFLNSLLRNAEWARRLDALLVQGDISMRLGSFIMLMLGCAGAGGLFATSVIHQPLFAIPAAAAAGSIPLLWARQKKTKRIRKFEAHFPDALDMLTNALRAGMALTGAIQIVADESPDPVGREFSILFEENRLGLDLREGLKKLAGRVDSAEVQLFVTAVIIQRETGGNLAEILEGTAAVIRDRFRILGDVRTMTAQARLSGFILIILPLMMAGLVSVVAPTYLQGLVADPMGKYLIVLAVVLQVVGFLAMRRIVDIKV